AAQHHANDKAELPGDGRLDARFERSVRDCRKPHIAAGQYGLDLAETHCGQTGDKIGHPDLSLAQIDAAQKRQIAAHDGRFCGWMVSPRASMSTKPAIFLARAAGVLRLMTRKVRAKRFCALSPR